MHYPVDIIAQCVRWYLAYALSLCNLEDKTLSPAEIFYRLTA
ncbi:hypothetical protein XBJ1_1772 [Xenorhabdus bovienii SS-2004]|uniref:Uncharacterized protein n=1 Tax=Xenorhabdus bovienii (strain SS-2004) TaxID=406818 RepID=D3V2D3_XENBS|nr:hypothetical protein XBJ1_1772 [Xenorhabdus bovienii SS-2004]